MRSEPSRARRWQPRLAALSVLLAALVGVTVATAAPASALGYPISYTVQNGTDRTLVFQFARGAGVECLPGSGGQPVCIDRNSDYSPQVSPTFVNPGGSFRLDSELDILTFRQRNTIIVTYRIDAAGLERVVLHTDPHQAKCDVYGTKAYTCVRLSNRDFRLVPAS